MDSRTRALIAALICLVVVALVVWHVWRRRQPTQYAGPVAYGLDFSWGRPSVASIKAGGYTFVCRYHSWDQTSGKNLTAAEAKSYLDAGIAVVSNWQYESEAPLQGYERGYADACEALWQHDEDGGDEHAPIYFSVDFDMQAHQYSAVKSYFNGVLDALSYVCVDPVARCGAYGSRYTIGRLFDDKLIAYGWQTYAWSYGAWDTRAQLRQTLNGQTLDGAAVDYDEAWSEDYGAWGQATRTQWTGDGAVILNDPRDPQRLDLFYVGEHGQVAHAWYPTGGMQALWTGNGGGESLGGTIVPGTLSAAWTATGDDINIVGLGVPDSSKVPVSCGQYWGHVLRRDGTRSGWGSVEKVYGQLPTQGTLNVEQTSSWRDPAIIVSAAALLIALALLAWLWLYGW